MALVSEEWKPRLPVPIVIGSGGDALIQILIISFSVFPRLNDSVGQACSAHVLSSWDLPAQGTARTRAENTDDTDRIDLQGRD